jgi:hypothetical protein
MKIKNTAPGGRGIGVAGIGVITWAPGEVKEVDDAVIAKAKADPANAAALAEGGELVEVKAKAQAASEPVVVTPTVDVKAADDPAAEVEKAEGGAGGREARGEGEGLGDEVGS